VTKESDMPCICGTEYVKVGDKSVCPKCGHVRGYKQIDIVQVLKENVRLRKLVEDMCECSGDLKGLVEEARRALEKS